MNLFAAHGDSLTNLTSKEVESTSYKKSRSQSKIDEASFDSDDELCEIESKVIEVTNLSKEPMMLKRKRTGWAKSKSTSDIK